MQASAHYRKLFSLVCFFNHFVFWRVIFFINNIINNLVNKCNSDVCVQRSLQAAVHESSIDLR